MTIDPYKTDSPSESVDRRVRRDRIFLNNPVIMQGLGLAPVIVAATTLNNALILSVAILLLLTPTRVISAFLCRFSFFRFRGMTYALTSAIVYIGVAFLLNLIFTSADIALLGLYLPLLVVDPIVLKRYERPQREHIKTALQKGIITSLGYILAMCTSAGIRELLGSGTLFGNTILKSAPFPMAGLPSGGFIMLALLIAVWRALVNVTKRQMGLEESQEL